MAETIPAGAVTAAEDVMREIARLRAHIDADHRVMVQLGIIADTAVKMLEHVNMDTEQDRDLHARATGALRGRLGELAAAIKEANEAAQVPLDTERQMPLTENG